MIIDNNFLIQIFIGILITLITAIISSSIKYITYKLVYLINKKWAGVLSTTIAVLVFVLGSYLVTVYTDIETTSFYVFIGLLITGVTLGISEFSGQVVSSFRILSNSYFSIGDYIKVNDFEGKIESITVDTIVLVTRTNERIILPIKTFLDSPVINRNSNRSFVLTADLPIVSTDIQSTERDIRIVLNKVVIDKKEFKSICYVRLVEMGGDATYWAIGVWSENSWLEAHNSSKLLKQLVVGMKSMGYIVGEQQEFNVVMK